LDGFKAIKKDFWGKAQKWLKDRKGRVINTKSRISPGLVFMHGDVLFIALYVLAQVF